MSHPAAQRLLRICAALGLLVLGSASVGSAQSAAAEEMKCAYSKRTICTSEGCTPVESEGIHLLLPALPTLKDAITAGAPVQVKRCDAKGCTAVDITSAASSGFLTLSSMHGAYLLKVYGEPDIAEIELRTGDFIEVVTSLLTTYVGYGSCSAPLP